MLVEEVGQRLWRLRAMVCCGHGKSVMAGIGKQQGPRLTRSLEERFLHFAARLVRRSERERKDRAASVGGCDFFVMTGLGALAEWLQDQMNSRSLTRAGRGIRDDKFAFLLSWCREERNE